MDARIWNGVAGSGWVAAEAALDQMFAPFDPLLMDGIAAGHVLDVGCGTGSTTLALARAGADCVGIDPSAPMLAAAGARMSREGMAAEFIQADAQTYIFAPGKFDAVVSRFGVMFFADPVAAFINLRRATQRGGSLRFAAWRGAAENPFLTVAEHVANPLLPGIVVPAPGSPGPFALAERGRILSILKNSGWAAIDIASVDVVCRFAKAELDNYLAVMGPVGRALQQADDKTRKRVMDVVRPAFEPFMHGEEVCFIAACWMVNAKAPSVMGRGAADA